jgi:hypothetical protein
LSITSHTWHTSHTWQSGWVLLRPARLSSMTLLLVSALSLTGTRARARALSLARSLPLALSLALSLSLSLSRARSLSLFRSLARSLALNPTHTHTRRMDGIVDGFVSALALFVIFSIESGHVGFDAPCGDAGFDPPFWFRIHGEWTGVSLARFDRLVRLVCVVSTPAFCSRSSCRRCTPPCPERKASGPLKCPCPNQLMY